MRDPNSPDLNSIVIGAGDLTEDLVSFVTATLADDVLDAVDVGRELDRQNNFASEPITIAAILICTTSAVIEIGRIVETWLENKREDDQTRLVIEAYTASPEAGAAVERAVTGHAKVAETRKLPQHPDYTKFKFSGLGQSSPQ
jgi:hypothetical protein